MYTRVLRLSGRLALVVLLFALSRAVYAYVLFVVSDFVHNHEVDMLWFVALVLASSAVLQLTMQQVWGALRFLKRPQVPRQ